MVVVRRSSLGSKLKPKRALPDPLSIKSEHVLSVCLGRWSCSECRRASRTKRRALALARSPCSVFALRQPRSPGPVMEPSASASPSIPVAKTYDVVLEHTISAGRLGRPLVKAAAKYSPAPRRPPPFPPGLGPVGLAQVARAASELGHTLWITAGLLWCRLCGAYYVVRRQSLLKPCKPPRRESVVLDRLLAGRHPQSNVELGRPMPLPLVWRRPC